MESFLLVDFDSSIQNKAIERVITPMTVQLCHLLISMERKDVKNEARASLQKVAEELASASEEFVHAARRLAGDSEEWLRQEMTPLVESLILSGRNITLVTQKLHLQPEHQCHRKELIAITQQILLDTTKVLLLEDAAMARKTEPVASWCLTCLDALEAAEDATSRRRSLADLAAALLHLGRLTARWARDERLGRARQLLGRCVPALLAAARGRLRHPSAPQLASSSRRVFALTRKSLGELLARLRRGAAVPAARSRNGALAGRLRQLRHLLAAPGPHLRGGRLGAPLVAVVWHCLRLAAGSAPRERMHLVACCHQLLELGARIDGPPGTSRGTECEALRAATDALYRGVRAGLLRQILDTFTDTHSPLEKLVQAALATSTVRTACDRESLAKRLRLLLDTFHDQARQMVRVAHLVLFCCPQPQTCRDLEAAVAGLCRTAVRAKELFSEIPHRCDPDWSPATLKALLEAWARESQQLLACFDDVLNIPEFLGMSIQEMTKHLNFYTWALRSGEAREFSRPVEYLQGRADHIVQVVSRYVDQNRDPIFRNGLRVLVQQLAQSSLTLGVATEPGTGGDSSQDRDAFLTMAKHLIYSAQQVQEGLDGTNHPDILSPLRDQVQKFDTTKGWPYFILPGLQHSMTPEMKCQGVPRTGESDPSISFLPAERLSDPVIPDTCTEEKGISLLATSKVTLTVETQDHQGVTSPCPDMLGKAATVDAAQETLAGEEPLRPERMIGPQELSTLVPSVVDLALETDYSTNARSDRLLEMPFQLSGKTRDNGQDLVARAGDWYHLCQQLFLYNATTDLRESMAVFREVQQNLAAVVQLAAKSGPMNLDEKDPDSVGDSGVLLQMQSRLGETEIHAKELLDKVLTSDGLPASKWQEENINNGCLLWSVAVQDLIQYVERLSRRQGLFLLPLRQAMKNQGGLQEGLDQAADVSERLQEAAKLSSLLCGDEQVKGEVTFLCGEIHVLRDALLEIVHILASSPKPSPSLSTRFELLCLELTLQVKALTGHLSNINADYERAFQDAVCPSLSVLKNTQSRTESLLESMVSGIQAVQGIIAGSQESGPCQEDLLVSLESILVLTKEVAQRVCVLREHPEEWRLYMLDRLQWEWAAKAHHIVTQLQAWQGGHTKAWRLLAQCLKPREEPARAPKLDPVQLQLHCEEGTAGATAGGSMNSRAAVPRGTPEGSMGTCTGELATIKTTTADMNTSLVSSGLVVHSFFLKEALSYTQKTGSRKWALLQQFTLGVRALREGRNTVTKGSPSPSPGCPARPHDEMNQPASEDVNANSENRITQIIQEMAKEVCLMTQNLKRRGHVLTKDQLTTSARKIVASGQIFTRLMRIIAKNCVDQRCSQELLSVVEQIQTMSSQLRIISSVKASLERSKSSEELLVENAQQLLQAVSKTVRAAEAASLRGLRQLSSDPEELEVAAFCMQCRRKLLRHRFQETATQDCDELGLRKTSTKNLPASAALVQEA